MFIPINITCTLDENVKRLTSTDRLTKNKLINIEILSEIRARSYIPKFNVPYELEVDVTGKTVTGVARIRAAHIASASAESAEVI